MVLQVLGLVAALGVAGPEGGTTAYCLDGARAEGAEAQVVAAECLAAAGDWAAAAGLYERVAGESPRHPLAERALGALVSGYRATAQFERAAQAAETLVNRYPRNADAPGLLIEAAWWRVGLGQRAQADADFERFEAMYGRADPGRAAEVFWARREVVAGDEAELQAHLGEYLRRHGKVGGADRRIVAEVQLGQIEWRQACDKGLLADLCMTIERKYVRPDCVYVRPTRAAKFLVEKPQPREPRYCGEEYPRFTFFPRTPRLAASAQRRFAAALRAAHGVVAPADTPERAAALVEALSFARMYRADARLVEAAVSELPAGPLFTAEDPPRQPRLRAEWLRRFEEHVARTRRRAQTAAQEYAEVTRGGAAWELMVAWRVAVLHESVGQSLAQIEIPAALDRRFAEQRTYCAEFEPATAPSFAAADAEYRRCAALPLAGDRFGVQPLCEDAMRVREPVGYPSQTEMVGEPVSGASRPESFGLQPFARWSAE